MYPDTDFSKSMNVGNYNYYEITSGDNFCVVSRIGDTMIYCVALKENKSDITSLIDTLGY